MQETRYVAPPQKKITVFAAQDFKALGFRVLRLLLIFGLMLIQQRDGCLHCFQAQVLGFLISGFWVLGSRFRVLGFRV